MPCSANSLWIPKKLMTNHHITPLIPDYLANNVNLIAFTVNLLVEDRLMKTMVCSQIWGEFSILSIRCVIANSTSYLGIIPDLFI